MVSTTPLCRSGPAMLSPSRIESWTWPSARDTTALPTVSRVMFRASRIGTPEEISVPSVRANLAIAVRLVMLPIIGMCIFTQSSMYCPLRLAFVIRRAAQSRTGTNTSTYQYSPTKWETPTRILVGSGN